MQENNSSTPRNGVKETDPEVGPVPVEEDAARSRDQSPSAPNPPSLPSQGEPNFGDSSGPLFSMYSKAAEDEDNKMADRWQKDADGILIFTGLFSAAVAALLAVTVQSLFPNSQDTSAFYLGNIYQVLIDPNAKYPPIPLPVATSRAFSPPSYSIWVNSLWFLSLVISLTCALLATSSHQWARRYIRVTQPARCSPEKRARMRAFFANGVERTQIARVVEGLPTLLHLSVFLFFAGLAILLFNVNIAVFNSVVWLIGIFSIVYGLITLMPLVRHDSPYFSPLSLPAWFLYASISYFFLKVFFAFKSDKILVYKDWQYWRDLRDRHRGRIFGGVERAAEETVSERSSEIDADIIRWTINALGDDDEMENFFDAVPGFFKSKLVKDLSSKLSGKDRLLERFWKAANGFFERTLSSNSVIEYVKSRRLDTGMNAMSTIPIPDILSIPKDILYKPWDQELQNIEMGHTVARWCTSQNRHVAQYARCIATRILASVRERNDRWYALATSVLGLSFDNLRACIDRGNDSLSLAILISVARRHIHSDFYDWGLLLTLYRLNIRNTLPELQDAFCKLWNDCVEEARNQPPDTFPVGILRLTRFLYIRLHEGTRAAPTHFSAQTQDFDHVLYRPESYPLCDIHHRPNSTIFDSLAVPFSTEPNTPIHRYQPSYGSGNAQRLAEELTVITGTPLHDVITSLREMQGSSQASPAISPALPVHTNPYSLDNNKQQDVAAPRAVPDIGQSLTTAPTSSHVPASTTPILSQPLGSYDAGHASILALSLPASPTTPTYPSQTWRLPNPELLALLTGSGTSLSGPRDGTTSPRLRARGLMNQGNQGNMYFTNAVLQLLVHCPSFWNLFSDLGRKTGQLRQGGVQQSSGGITPLVDATVKLLDEFAYKKEDDDTEPFTPMYVYDALKENRQFKSILSGQQRDAKEYLLVYLNVLEEELLALLTNISTHKPAFTTSPSSPVEERKEGSQSGEGQTGVGKRDYISPISRIFDGKFCMTGQDEIVQVESWRTLQLDIQPDSVYTVQDALALLSRPQPVQVEPSDPSKTSQQVTVLVEALPPVLIVHLKRFLYDTAAGSVVKNRKPVQFSPELEIPPHIIVSTAGRPAEPVRYTLNGVLYHHGTTASGGHYTVDVLHSNAHEGGGDIWLRVDDDVVSTVRHEEVFGRYDNEGPETDDRCSYLLLYHRTASPQTR